MGQSYNIKAIQLSIGGLVIEGFGDSDAISFAPGADIHTKFTSADGQVMVSAENDPSIDVTITVNQKSSAQAILLAIWRAQDTAERAGLQIPATPFFFKDPSSGDQYSDQNAVVMALPESSFGKEIQTREWKILLPNGRDRMILGGV